MNMGIHYSRQDGVSARINYFPALRKKLILADYDRFTVFNGNSPVKKFAVDKNLTVPDYKIDFQRVNLLSKAAAGLILLF